MTAAITASERVALEEARSLEALRRMEAEDNVDAIRDRFGQPFEPAPEVATSSDGLCIVSASELLALDLPPREQILGPWLPAQGLVMVHAPRGVGKTFFALSVAYAVASGSQLFEWQAPKPRGVLYVDGELPVVVLRERVARVAASAEQEPVAPLRFLSPDLQPNGIPNLSTIDGQDAVNAALEGIELLILDPISVLCPNGRENEGESWLPVQHWLLSLRARGVSVLLLHHSGKSGQQRGTSRREDTLDTVVNLRRPIDCSATTGAQFELHFEKARGFYGKDAEPLNVKLATAGDKLAWTATQLELSRTERVAELVRDGLTGNEIADVLGVTKGTVSKHKKSASRLGLLGS